jgi:membrane fusion protein (multidrug efflux system)
MIARLDDREFGPEAERSQAERDQAKANLDRKKKLAADGAISPQELEDAQTSLQVAEAVAALARARLEKTLIRAPFPGLVGVRRVSRGAYMREGQVITDLTRVDEMKVTFSAPERYAKALRPGIDVELRTPAFPGEVFVGKLSVVDPVVDPETRHAAAGGAHPEPGRAAAARHVGRRLGHARRAQPGAGRPDEAVFAQGNQNFVYVVKATARWRSPRSSSERATRCRSRSCAASKPARA